jgi:hypothetical protein
MIVHIKSSMAKIMSTGAFPSIVFILDTMEKATAQDHPTITQDALTKVCEKIYDETIADKASVEDFAFMIGTLIAFLDSNMEDKNLIIQVDVESPYGQN